MGGLLKLLYFNIFLDHHGFFAPLLGFISLASFDYPANVYCIWVCVEYLNELNSKFEPVQQVRCYVFKGNPNTLLVVVVVVPLIKRS